MKSLLCILLALVLLTGCDNGDEITGLTTQLTIAEMRLALASARAENNLIRRIDSDDDFYTIHFEDASLIAAKRGWIEHIVYDSSRWVVTFHFRDETNETAHFIGALNFDEGDVVLNPFLTSPLAALAGITTPVDGRFKVSVKGKSPMGITIERTFEHFGETHAIPILGLYEDYLNRVEFVFMNQQGVARCSKTIYVQTRPIENRPFLEIEILKNDLPEVYAGLYCISNLRIAFDQYGEIRWYHDEPRTSFFGKVRNGNYIVADATNQNFFEVSMLGQRVRQYAVPNGLHHEIFEMATGNFLVASYSPPGPPFEDRVIEISRTSGAAVRSWDFNTILDPFRTPLPDTQSGDWLHINALYYDETDNSIVISGRSQCAVVKIDYASGVIKWILGHHNGWPESLQPFLLKPVNSQGVEIDDGGMDFWSYGQHSIHRLMNGNVLLYDNGDFRGFYDDPDAPATSYTRIAEYKIDEEQMTVSLAWEFTNDKSVFTKFTGSTQLLADDRRLAGYMWVSENSPKIVEVSTDNKIVYEATVNRGKAFYYRATKIDVYQGID